MNHVYLELLVHPDARESESSLVDFIVSPLLRRPSLQAILGTKHEPTVASSLEYFGWINESADRT